MSHGLTVVTVARHLRRFFIDDGWAHGPAEAGGQLVQDVGLGPADVAGITAGWRQALAAAQTAIVGAGAFNWQLMANSGTAAKAPFNNCTVASTKDISLVPCPLLAFAPNQRSCVENCFPSCYLNGFR